MGKIETRKRDCRRSVGIKYKIKPLKKMAHSRDKRTGMNRQQNLCLIPVRLYPFFRNGFILRWWRKICVVKGGKLKTVSPLLEINSPFPILVLSLYSLYNKS